MLMVYLVHRIVEYIWLSKCLTILSFNDNYYVQGTSKKTWHGATLHFFSVGFCWYLLLWSAFFSENPDFCRVLLRELKLDTEDAMSTHQIDLKLVRFKTKLSMEKNAGGCTKKYLRNINFHMSVELKNI